MSTMCPALFYAENAAINQKTKVAALLCNSPSSESNEKIDTVKGIGKT